MTQTSDYYKDKIAVVTGGASGIGLALGETMLSYGAAGIVLADVDDEGLEQHTARLRESYPDKVLGVHCDVTKESDIQNLITKAAEFGNGHIHVLINNAAAALGGFFDTLSSADYENAFAINFYPSVNAIRAVLPIMRAQGEGHIVGIASGIAFWAMAGQSQYGATKAALNSLHLTLRYELWDENIRVTSATPGNVATPFWKRGGAEPPPNSVTPEEAAQAILAGVARNERLVLGATDAPGIKNAFAPDAAEGQDMYLLNVARERRKGHMVV